MDDMLFISGNLMRYCDFRFSFGGRDGIEASLYCSCFWMLRQLSEARQPMI